MIKTKCIFDPPEEDDGIRIMITRLWARGKTWSDLNIDLKVKELAPSKDLVLEYKQKRKSEKGFLEHFLKELKQFHAQRWLKVLAKIGTKTTITLCCFEPEGEFCHRYIVKELLEDMIK